MPMQLNDAKGVNCAVSQHLQDSTMDVYHDTKGLFINTQSINYSSIT